MKIKINENYRSVGKSYLFSEIASRVAKFTAAHPEARIIRLGIGDVTLPLTPAVTSAMAAAVAEMAEKSTFRGYAPEFGYDFLLEAIKRRYARYGVALGTSEIFVSDGAKSDVGNITELFGDNTVLIPDPVYPVYLDSNLMAGRRVEFLPATEENGFLPMPDGIRGEGEGYIIYICSPPGWISRTGRARSSSSTPHMRRT